jgi:hypothetical protein
MSDWQIFQVHDENILVNIDLGRGDVLVLPVLAAPAFVRDRAETGSAMFSIIACAITISCNEPFTSTPAPDSWLRPIVRFDMTMFSQ